MRRIPIFVKIIIILLLLGVKIIEPLIFSWLKVSAQTAHYTDIFLNLAIFIFGLNLFANLMLSFRKVTAQRKRDTIALGIENIYYLIVAGATFMTILALFGINIQTLFATLSIVAAAIAIVTKDYIVNILGGMLIAFSNELSVDDYIKIGDKKGKVIDIKIAKLHLLTDDDDVIVIPNNEVYLGSVINYTKREVKKTSIEFEIELKDLKSVEQLEEQLIDSIKEYKDEIQEDSYYLKVVEIKSSSVSLKFQYILNYPNRDLEREIRKAMIRKVITVSKHYGQP